MKPHALRALSAFLMARHSRCPREGHPFCGYSILDMAGSEIYGVVYAIAQQGEDDGSPVVSLYFCRARAPENVDPAQLRPEQYLALLTPAGEVLDRKLVVQLVSNGYYLGIYGSIINHVKEILGQIDR